MNNWQPIVPGVLVHDYDLNARFTKGSLAGLAESVRNAMWRHVEVFESADVVRIFAGGNRRSSMEPPLEVARGESGQAMAIALPPKLARALRTARAQNLPARENAIWECTCRVYCDQSHGEGRIELRVMRPSFHEIAAIAA